MEKRKKRIAEAPDGMEYIWVRDPGLKTLHSPKNGFVGVNKKDAEYYQHFELRMKRTGETHTYEGYRRIFVDIPVFEVEV